LIDTSNVFVVDQLIDVFTEDQPARTTGLDVTSP